MKFKFKKLSREISLNLKDFQKRVGISNLSDRDKELVVGLAEVSDWLDSNLEKKDLTISKLRKVFGCSSEKKSTIKKDKKNKKRSRKKSSDSSEKSEPANDSSSNQTETTSGEVETNNTENSDLEKTNTKDKNTETANANSNTININKQTDPEEEIIPKKNTAKQGKNNGRNPVSKYTGAEDIFIELDFLNIGDDCPDPDCFGKLYPFKSLIVLRLSSQSFASAKKYILEQLRCNLCNKIYTANYPEDAKKPRYDFEIKAHLCICKYYLGVPFYRIERYQDLMGIPLPDSTQWDKVKEVDNEIFPVYEQLEHEAAQAENINVDDTSVKILSLIEENKSADIERKGMFTTGIVAERKDNKVALFYSGRNYAKENSELLLVKRESDSGDLIQMSDALKSRNIPKLPEGLEIKILICFCLVHGRRKFYEIFDFYPKICYRVIAELAKVYKNESICKKQGLKDQERLEYHQKHSARVMERLHFYLQAQFEKKRCEPNSNIGGAIKYMLKYWHELTQFLRIPGAQLDNNIAERALKIPIRVRKTAMFYKTTNGAKIGNRLMSIIYTCELNKINPVKYLVALQENSEEIKKYPERWLPWNYHINFNNSQQAA